MCKEYIDNRYPILWIPHAIMVLSIFIGLFSKRFAICKKFFALILLTLHSYWLVGDLTCHTPVMNNAIGLFINMYFLLLILFGFFDSLLRYCKCWGKEELDEFFVNEITSDEIIINKI